MKTTKERVLAKIYSIKKKPVRKTIKTVRKVAKPKKVAPYRSLEKYSIMLKKLGDHFGDNAIPDLLEFIANRKEKETRKRHRI